MTSKIDVFEMPIEKVFLVTLENIVWAPGVQNDAGDEWFPRWCNIIVEADRNSPITDIIRAAKVSAAKKYGAGVMSADATIDRDEPDPEETLDYEGEIY